jgi:hypothetical protein
MSKGGYSGPSAAELSAQAKAEADAELARLKQQQDFETEKLNTQMAFDREQSAQQMALLKQQGDLQFKTQQDAVNAQKAAEEKKLLEEKNQEELKAQQERDRATNQSDLNSTQLAADLARRKTYAEAMYYLDNDSSTDVANQTTTTRRQNVAKAY